VCCFPVGHGVDRVDATANTIAGGRGVAPRRNTELHGNGKVLGGTSEASIFNIDDTAFVTLNVRVRERL
jgi:hypothetical protein